MTTIAGDSASAPGSTDGTGSAARFNNPFGLGVDTATNIFVADYNNNTIRKVTPDGTNWVVTTIAGKAGTAQANIDGTGSVARFNLPGQLAVDSATNLYVADTGNNTIREVTPDGTNWVVKTIAGNHALSGFADGTGSAARFNSPFGVAVDSATNLYVADDGNGTIRKVTPDGTNWVVTTIAGNHSISGSADGIGTAARFQGPVGVAVDGATNLYVAEYGNLTIRKLTQHGTNWVVTTLAGKALQAGSANGIGSAARFGHIWSPTMDNAGSIYVADSGNNTIRKGTPPLVIGSAETSVGADGGQFAFALNGIGGQPVVVDASDDLANWSPIWTNTLTFPAAINFTDPGAGTNSVRFYRARMP